MTFDCLDSLIRKQMRKRNTPGFAIAATKNGELIYSKGFGCRDLKKFEPMDANTLIGIGSVTKSFTAFSILKLQDINRFACPQLNLPHELLLLLPLFPELNHHRGIYPFEKD